MNLWKAHFTLGVRANVQPKSSIPIGAKVEISPKGLRDPKYPLTSSARRWFRLSFRTPISVLHSPARGGFIFLYLSHTQTQKGQKILNPATEQRSS